MILFKLYNTFDLYFCFNNTFYKNVSKNLIVHFYKIISKKLTKVCPTAS